MALPELDPVIHQATRLRIMALLYRNRYVAFTWARNVLGLTDGNLDTHAKKLEEAGYIKRGRVLAPGGFQVRLKITPEGDAAFHAYLEGLRGYLAIEGGSVAGETDLPRPDAKTGDATGSRGSDRDPT